jgi:hypothetical protein
MSTPFYDLASLVVVPSGYKASKVYAQKPLTTDGQLSFSRASTATRVNASGLIETVASGVPRLDYLGSTCPKLLLEPQRINNFLRSSEFTSTWVNTGATVTADQAASPTGTVDADEISGYEIYQQRTQANATTYTFSVFIKKNTATQVVIRYVDNATGFVGGSLTYTYSSGAITVGQSVNSSVSGKAENYGNGWIRLSMTYTTTTTVTFNYQAIGSTGSSYIWGAQLELGTYPTSYIPTTTAAVTRVAETAVKTGISSLIGQQEGVIYWEGIVPPASEQGGSFASTLFNTARNSNTNAAIEISHSSSLNRLNALFFNGTGTFNPIAALYGVSVTSGSKVKIAFAYKSGQFALYVNGVSKATNANTFTSITTISEINLADRVVYYGYPSSVTTEQVLIFKTRLTNAQLAELTTL